MAKSTVNFDLVSTIALELPGVEEGTAYGARAWKVGGQLLACIPTNRSVEPESLLVRVAFDDRAELLAEDPMSYYITDHYLKYTGVLVRLSKITPEKLHGLLSMAHKFVRSEASTRVSGQKRRR